MNVRAIVSLTERGLYIERTALDKGLSKLWAIVASQSVVERIWTDATGEQHKPSKQVLVLRDMQREVLIHAYLHM